MYIIRDWSGSWLDPKLLAAYEIVGEHIIFDVTRGNSKFRESLMAYGVPVLGEGGKQSGYVHPDEGMAFHEACLILFSTRDQSISDEAELKEMQRKLDSGENQNANFPPVDISAA